MIEKLIENPEVLSRHKNAPFIEERERYLEHKANEGYAQSTLIGFANELILVAQHFKCDENNERWLVHIRGS